VAAEPLPPSGLVLICGASRSGKSSWAEHLASQSGRSVVYLATSAARPDDRDWTDRLALHRQRRPSHWGLVETGACLSEALAALRGDGGSTDSSDSQHGLSGQGPLLLIDSLGTWLAQHLEAGTEAWETLQQILLQELAAHPGPVLLVCEEVGWGVVPPTAVGGLFRDRMGALQQRLMRQAVDSWLVVAGRALNLHALGQPVPGG
jgi:adenosylcobinamide kinase / adenosylcobinamide-phosphate guanylyltransferase